MVSALLVGVSLWGQGFLTPNMTMVVVWMIIWSTGAHLFMAMSSAIGLRLAEEGHEGQRLGQLGSLESLGTLVGLVIVYLGASRFHFSFGILFGIAGIFALISALCLYLIKPQPLKKSQAIVFKKKYLLFYLLNILFGARKQIFLTFAPWVLIKIFNCQVSTFALLGLIGTTLSFILRPVLGHAIDSLGERLIITIESIILIMICILYGFAPAWFSATTAVTVIMACYVTDQLLFSLKIARNTYLNRIVDCKEDIAPSISMGITLDHAVSMIVPFWGGLLWVGFGFQWVFLAAAIIAFFNLLTARLIPELENKQPSNQI
jgi:predicted MFS family arabinose efflux permease